MVFFIFLNRKNAINVKIIKISREVIWLLLKSLVMKGAIIKEAVINAINPTKITEIIRMVFEELWLKYFAENMATIKYKGKMYNINLEADKFMTTNKTEKVIIKIKSVPFSLIIF